MIEEPTPGGLIRAGDAGVDLDEIRRRISRLTKSRLHGGLNQMEEKEYDDLTRLELDLVEREN
jgi:hypothetical protein